MSITYSQAANYITISRQIQKHGLASRLRYICDLGPAESDCMHCMHAAVQYGYIANHTPRLIFLRSSHLCSGEDCDSLHVFTDLAIALILSRSL